MADETLRFDIIGNDRGSDAFKRVGEAASGMGFKMDGAAKQALGLDEALKRQQSAARASADATLALAKTDDILIEVEKRLRDGALESEFALKREAAAKRDSARASRELGDAEKNRAGLLSRLFGGGSGGSGGGGLLSALPAASGWVNPYTIAGGVAAAPFLGTALGGSVLGALGAGITGLGIFGALSSGGNATPAQMRQAQLRTLAAQQNLAALQAKGSKAAPASVTSARASLASAQSAQAALQPPNQARAAFSSLFSSADKDLQNISKVFQAPLAQIAKTFGTVLPYIFKPLGDSLKQIAGPLQQIGLTLAISFASPRIQQAIAAVTKAFTQFLGGFSGQIPVIVNALATGVESIANSFTRHPDMIIGMEKVTAFLFSLPGYVASGLAALTNVTHWLLFGLPHDVSIGLDNARKFLLNFGKNTEDDFNNVLHAIRVTWNDIYGATIGSAIRIGHDAETQFNSLRHATANIFNGVRHDIATAWNDIYGATIGVAIRIGHNTETQFSSFRHATANIFDGVRADIAHYWDMIWNNTVGRVSRGIGDVTRWFGTLPGRVTDALKTLGGDLLNIGKWAIGELLAGLKSAAGAITGGGVLGWLGGFAKGVVGVFKKIWGWFSPSSVMYEGGKSLMQGLANGIRDHAHLAQQNAAAAAQKVANAGSGVQRWAGLVAQALRMEGLPAGLASAVLYQMQTESGGNPNAQNNTDINAQMGIPSQGLMQVIPPTFALYHWPGTSGNIRDPLANIAAAINYARRVYGPTLMSGGMGIGSGHGYATGTMSAAPGWAWVGEHGPELMHFRGGEQVVPAGRSGGGNTYNISITLPPGSDREQVRRIIGYIKQYEKGSGTGWRK